MTKNKRGFCSICGAKCLVACWKTCQECDMSERKKHKKKVIARRRISQVFGVLGINEHGVALVDY